MFSIIDKATDYNIKTDFFLKRGNEHIDISKIYKSIP